VRDSRNFRIFGRKCHRYGSIYRQSETNLIGGDPSRIWQKVNEFWSTNKTVRLSYFGCLISAYTISTLHMLFSVTWLFSNYVTLPGSKVYRFNRQFVGLTAPGGLTLGFAINFYFWGPPPTIGAEIWSSGKKRFGWNGFKSRAVSLVEQFERTFFAVCGRNRFEFIVVRISTSLLVLKIMAIEV